MIKLLFGVHLHQPVDNLGVAVKKAIEFCYAPFFKLTSQYREFKFALHSSGWILEYIKDNYPKVFMDIKREKKNQEPDFYEYSIESNYSFKIEPYYQELWRKSIFILASNNLNREPEKIIKAYKNQFVIERGFRFVKSPDFLADYIYLKKLNE